MSTFFYLFTRVGGLVSLTFLMLCLWMMLRMNVPPIQSALHRMDRWQQQRFRQRRILAIRSAAIRQVGQVTGIRGAIHRLRRQQLLSRPDSLLWISEYTNEWLDRNGALIARVVFFYCALQLLRAFVL